MRAKLVSSKRALPIRLHILNAHATLDYLVKEQNAGNLTAKSMAQAYDYWSTISKAANARVANTVRAGLAELYNCQATQLSSDNFTVSNTYIPA